MPKITEMYAFILEDTGPNDEGVIGIKAPNDTGTGSVWLPLVGGDMARINSLKPLAIGIGNQVGKKVKLVHFTNREEMGYIN